MLTAIENCDDAYFSHHGRMLSSLELSKSVGRTFQIGLATDICRINQRVARLYDTTLDILRRYHSRTIDYSQHRATPRFSQINPVTKYRPNKPHS